MKIHIVKKGDSLNEIAKKYNVELDQLVAFNPQIEDPNMTDVGMKVRIPVSPKPVEQHAAEYAHKHIVKQGDSLWKLGKAWEIPLQDMIKANPQLKNPNVLMTGEVVYIPKLPQDVAQGADAFMPQLPQEGNQFPFPPLAGAGDEMPYPPMAMMPTMPSMPQFPQEGIQYPFPSMAMMPTETPMQGAGNEMPYPPMATMPTAPSMPYMQGPMGDISSTHAPVTPAGPGHFGTGIKMGYTEPGYDTTELKAGFPMPGYDASGLQAGYPPEASQEGYMQGSAMPGLHEPYPQAVHPFQQYSIPATEAFAYPPQPGYPSMSSVTGMHQMPWAANETGAYPQYPDYAMGSYSVPGYSDGGCGCGSGSSSHTSNFMQPYYPSTPMPIYQQSTMYPSPSYPVGGELTPGYMPHMQMAPTGFPYPAAYEEPKLPQEANIHQWDETSELTEEMEDERSSSSSRAKSGAKKNKPSGSASLSLKRKQSQEIKSEPRPNLPWINV